MKKLIITIISILFASLPAKAFAYTNWSQDVNIFSMYDVFFDVLSFSVAIATLGVGLQIANKLSGGLKAIWKFSMIVVLLFIAIQIFSLLSVFDIFRLSGLFAIMKLLMSVAFLGTVLSAKNFVVKVLRSKSIRNKDIISKE